MANDRLVNVTLTANTAPYVAGMNSATAATQRTATTATAASAGIQRTGQTMANTAGQAGLLRSGLTTPIAAAGAAIIGTTKASIDWESAWAGVTKTVDGSEKQLSALEGDLRGMAKTLPATHGEIASVAEAAGQLGVQTENVSDFTRTMVDLGETTNLTADQAATSVARIANVMGTAESDVDRLGSSLVDLGNNSATTEAEILEMAQRIAGAGSTIGMSEQDVLGFAAALSSVGIRAEAGGTAISRVMVDISNAVESGGDKLDELADVAGMSAEEFATAFREDPAAAIEAFVGGLGEIQAAGGNVFAQLEQLDMSQVRIRDALLRMAESGDVLSDSLDTSSEAWEENIALTEEAEKRYGTTAASLTTSLNQVKDAAIDLGGLAAPVLAEVAGVAADLVSGLQVGITKMRELQVQAAKDAGATDEQASETRTGFLPLDVLSDLGRVSEDVSADVEALSMGESFWSVLTDGYEEAEEAAGFAAKYDAEIQGLLNRVPPATEEQKKINKAIADYSAETKTATERTQDYQDQLRASVDPVFAMFDAVTDADEAQTAYNEAVDEYGKNSPEARDASIDLARAVSSAQQAALDGELSFDQFEAKLGRWVEQGVISKEAAQTLKGAVKDLREESEDYDGTYKGQMEAGGTSQAQAEINGLINRANEWDGSQYSATVNLGATGMDVGRFFGAAGVHTGGEVTSTGQIRRFHGGGAVDSTIPRFHSGVSQLASDEVPAILQRGELVFSADQADHLKRAMSPMARGPMGGGSAGGTASEAAQIVIQHMEMKAVGEPFNASHVASKLEAHMARSGAA